MYKEYLNTALNESFKTFESRSRNTIPKRKLKESTNSGMPRKVTVDDLIDTYDGNEMVYDKASGLTQMTTNIICNDEPIDSLSWEFDASNYPQYFGDSDNPKDDWDGFFDDPEVRDIMQEFVDKLNKTIQSIYEPGDVICINNTPYDYKYAVYLTEGMRRKNGRHTSMESFNLHEGNRRAKQLLYNKNNPNLSVADALLELLYTRYDTIGDSEWFAELNKYKNVFSKSHIYHLSEDTPFYLQYYKYMMDNNLTDALDNIPDELHSDDMPSLDDVMRAICFPTSSDYFPVKFNSFFANTHNNRLIAVTENETMIMMDAFFTPLSSDLAKWSFFLPSKERYKYAAIIEPNWIGELRCSDFIKKEFINANTHCQSNQAEKSFYKDVYRVNFS